MSRARLNPSCYLKRSAYRVFSISVAAQCLAAVDLPLVCCVAARISQRSPYRFSLSGRPVALLLQLSPVQRSPYRLCMLCCVAALGAAAILCELVFCYPRPFSFKHAARDVPRAMSDRNSKRRRLVATGLPHSKLVEVIKRLRAEPIDEPIGECCSAPVYRW